MSGQQDVLLTHYRTLIENEYLGQWDLADGKGGYKEAVVVIESVSRFRPKQVRKKNGEPEKNTRVVVGFIGKRKKWLCGRVSQEVLAQLFGPMVERWKGQKVRLYVDPDVRFGRRVVGGIRVRGAEGHHVPTEDPLDNPVDAERSAQLEAAVDEWDADPDKGP